MARNLEQLIQKQRELEVRYQPLVEALHPARTVTLYDILTNPAAVQKLWGAPWLKVDQLGQRIDAGLHFLRGIPPKKEFPVMFFQRPDPVEDEKHRQFQIENNEFFGDVFEEYGTGIRYLHTSTNFWTQLHGSFTEKTLHIRAGFSFTTDPTDPWAKTTPIGPVPRGTIMGYQIPNYAEHIGVSDEIATDYLARMVVHDLAHMILPNIGTEGEPLHDISMLYAMGVRKGEVRYDSHWEALVHAECTDPFFFLKALRRLRLAQTLPLSPIQSYLRTSLEVHFMKTAGRQQLREFWSLPGPKGHKGRTIVERRIREMQSNGFKEYNKYA